VSQPNNTINEKWKITPGTGPTAGLGFSIESAHNGSVVQVKGGATEEGSQVVIDKGDNQQHQIWVIQ
jgi:hypothetical protein